MGKRPTKSLLHTQTGTLQKDARDFERRAPQKTLMRHFRTSKQQIVGLSK